MCLHDWMDVLRVKVAASVGEKTMTCRGSGEMKAENSDKFGSFPGPRAMAIDVGVDLASTKGGERESAIVLPNRLDREWVSRWAPYSSCSVGALVCVRLAGRFVYLTNFKCSTL